MQKVVDNTLKWIGTIVVVVTIPLWIFPLIFVLLLTEVHEDLWRDE